MAILRGTILNGNLFGNWRFIGFDGDDDDEDVSYI